MKQGAVDAVIRGLKRAGVSIVCYLLHLPVWVFALGCVLLVVGAAVVIFGAAALTSLAGVAFARFGVDLGLAILVALSTVATLYLLGRGP